MEGPVDPAIEPAIAPTRKPGKGGVVLPPTPEGDENTQSYVQLRATVKRQKAELAEYRGRIAGYESVPVESLDPVVAARDERIAELEAALAAREEKTARAEVKVLREEKAVLEGRVAELEARSASAGPRAMTPVEERLAASMVELQRKWREKQEAGS
jgi:BMFP domain-containing protein YqiC